MKKSSYWRDTVEIDQFPKLNQDLKVDVAVVGAGLTGTTTAYLLKKAGYRVALIERFRCGGVDSSHTTAHLTCVTDLRLCKLIANFGRKRAKALWTAGMAAIDQIEKTVREENIDCEFKRVPGYLHASLRGADKHAENTLRRDAELANELGFPAEYMDEVPYFALPGVKFANQAKFHPLKYLDALLRKIPGDGSYVFAHTEVNEVERKPITAVCGRNRVECSFIVLATHTPLLGKTNTLSGLLLQTKLYLYTSYVLGARLPTGILPEALFWDTSDPYYYLRVDRRGDSDYIIFGGEDHKTGQKRNTEIPFRKLEQRLRSILPSARIEHRWSGQVIETNDGLPYIGETSRHQFTGTGCSGNGMTFGTLTAIMAVDAFLKRKSPWTRLLSPTRKKLKGGLVDYLRENKDYPYYFFRDRLKEEGTSFRSLPRGQGKIVRLRGKRVAAYRDEQGRMTVCSPVCTHLGCLVNWNAAEGTWDCPCHGSRFKATGEVLAGPAERNLKKTPKPEPKGQMGAGSREQRPSRVPSRAPSEQTVAASARGRSGRRQDWSKRRRGSKELP